MAKLKKGVKIIAILLIIPVFSFCGIGLGFAAGSIKSFSEIDDSSLRQFAATSSIYDNDGNLIEELHGIENRIPVNLKDISPYVIDALLAVEDQRFFEHHGLDFFRTAKALMENIKNRKIVQGGSTLTQQLVGLSLVEEGRTLQGKAKEALVALAVENKYSKEEILESYLNKVYFGHGSYGIEAASRKYFAKSAKDLAIEEAALLVGIIQNPSGYSPFFHLEKAKNRRDTVINALVRSEKITPAEGEELKEKPIKVTTSNQQDDYKYQSFIDFTIEEALQKLKLTEEPGKLYTGGYKIYTTLDAKIQDKMEDVYNNADNFPQGNDDKLIESAMVVLDYRTGEIKGLIGGRNIEGKRSFNRATQALRQPGSAMKPLTVFGPALELGYSPATVIDDYPQVYKIGKSYWTPKNYDDKYRGLVSMRTAAKYSINVWSVKMLEKIGIEEGFQFAEKLGISTLVSSGKYNDKGYSLALGGLTKGISPLEITAAYGTFANKGVYVEPHVIKKIVDSKGIVVWESNPARSVAMKEETAYMVTSILQTGVQEGTGKWAGLVDRPVAGKTGTSSDNKDAWFIGYTPNLVATVWLGYDEPEEMENVTGGGVNAGPIWKEVMEVAHQGLPSLEFERPEGIVELSVDSKSGLLPSELTPPQFITKEIFAKENVPNEVSSVWEYREVCSQSGLLPTDNCPSLEKKLFLKRPIPWSSKGLPERFNDPFPLDASLEVPREKCLFHNPPFDIDIKTEEDVK